MNNELWTQIEDAYTAASRIPRQNQRQYLQQAFGDRPEVVEEVESLLRYQDAANRLNPSAILESAASLLAGDDAGLIGSVVAGKYVIRRCLGSTATNEVYLADHLTLGVPFALKRPAPDFRNDAAFRRRLVDEGRRAVALKHENVTRVHDVIESGDDVFLVMEYVEGDTLRSRLSSSQAMTTAEFLSIAFQSASALAAAHAKSIVHLDVKPENIMITPAGQVKICDFGVARKLSTSASDDTASTLDACWTMAGTPGYMAPEVILGHPFDQRADLFSLGIVFYEMLTGRNPFAADTIVTATARVVSHVPEPVHASKPDVDPKLDRIVMRLLAKDPDERYAGAEKLLEDLQIVRRSQERVRDIVQNLREAFQQARGFKLAAAVIVLALIAILPAILVFQGRPENAPEPLPLPEKKIVAVLPFRVIGEGPGERFYSEGVSEILTSKLAQLTTIKDLQVVPEFEIRDRRIDGIEKARAEFGATLVLDGVVQFAGSQLRVRYSLLEAASRRTLRTGFKEFAAADPFAVQDAVIRDVISMLQLELTPAVVQTLQVFGTANPQAYFLYTEARGALRNFQTPENIDKAAQLFTQAAEMDPDYALAYAGLGQSYWRKFSASKNNDWLELAERYCQKAAQLDHQLSEAYFCLGAINESKGHYELAAGQFNQALAIEPANDDAQRELGRSLEASERFAEAEGAYSSAIKNRPYYWEGYLRLAAFYVRRHRYDKAIENYKDALALCPDSGQLYYSMGGAYMEAGDYSHATDALKKSIQIRPYWQAYYNLGGVHLRNRQYPEAAAAFENAAKATNDYRVSASLARVYSLSADSAKARNVCSVAARRGEALLQTNPRESDVHLLVGRCYAIMGLRTQAETHLNIALQTPANDPHNLVTAAVAYVLLGDRTTALNRLQQAAAHGATQQDFRAEPELDVLAGDARFIGLASGNPQQH